MAYYFLHINIIPKPQTKNPQDLTLQILFLHKHIEEWNVFSQTSGLTTPVSDSRVIFNLGRREGGSIGEKEKKSLI